MSPQFRPWSGFLCEVFLKGHCSKLCAGSIGRMFLKLLSSSHPRLSESYSLSRRCPSRFSTAGVDLSVVMVTTWLVKATERKELQRYPQHPRPSKKVKKYPCQQKKTMNDDVTINIIRAVALVGFVVIVYSGLGLHSRAAGLWRCRFNNYNGSNLTLFLLNQLSLCGCPHPWLLLWQEAYTILIQVMGENIKRWEAGREPRIHCALHRQAPGLWVT